MISASPLTTIAFTAVTAASGRQSQNYLRNSAGTGVDFIESIYGNSYKLRVQDYNGTSPTPGDFSLEADVINISADSNINFAGFGSFISLSNKTIKTNSTQFKLMNVAGTEMEILCNNGAANFTMTNATTFKINVNGSTNTSNLTITGSGINQTLTSTGTITIDANTTFTSGRTVTFSGCTLVGLPAAALHKDTHQSVTSILSNAAPVSPIGTDPISAWQVGAVARALPVLLNKIAIAKTDGFYNQSVAFTDAQLYGGSLYSTLFSSGNTNHGPMYVVLANGQESNLTSGEAQGPPGQIIMIRKV
jgi:hypothetical protein